MVPFAGFPDDSKQIPVPNLLFGSLLEEIDDLLALKCFLRVLWLYSQKKGVPSVLIREELLSDRTLARVVSTSGESIESVAGQDGWARTVAASEGGVGSRTVRCLCAQHRREGGVVCSV